MEAKRVGAWAFLPPQIPINESLPKSHDFLASWWLNKPIWKIHSSKWESFPFCRGENKTNLKPPLFVRLRPLVFRECIPERSTIEFFSPLAAPNLNVSPHPTASRSSRGWRFFMSCSSSSEKNTEKSWICYEGWLLRKKHEPENPSWLNFDLYGHDAWKKFQTIIFPNGGEITMFIHIPWYDPFLPTKSTISNKWVKVQGGIPAGTPMKRSGWRGSQSLTPCNLLHPPKFNEAKTPETWCKIWKTNTPQAAFPFWEAA